MEREGRKVKGIKIRPGYFKFDIGITITAKHSISLLSMRKSKELVRNFIHDSLYNPTYGYFNKYVNILSTPSGAKGRTMIEFSGFRDQDAYYKYIKGLYEDYNFKTTTESATETESKSENKNRLKNFTDISSRQLWHTPSELFKPYYGRAIINYILSKSHIIQQQQQPLVIYEIGPGNGTLADNILSHLKAEHPQIYTQTEYNLIEISPLLRERQRDNLKSHRSRVKHSHSSILDIDPNFKEERNCWVLGMEVLDNLAHDLIKYDNSDGRLLQGHVNSDPTARFGTVPGKLWLEFGEAEDPLILQYMGVADALGWKSPSLKGKFWLRAVENSSIFNYINPWSCEYIPTISFKLFNGLNQHFPNHQMIFSDFHYLPDTIPGHTAPVVQTRYQNTTVPCSTILLKKGLFDIFFPTNFSKLSQLISHLRTCSNQNQNQIKEKEPSNPKVLTHTAFMRNWLSSSDLQATQTRSGYNPLLQDYENVSFIVS